VSNIATDLLLDIASEKNGYSVGKPWRFSEFSLAAVVPILRAVDIEERGYRLLSEVEEGVSIKDTGSISKVEFTNKSGLAILLKAGEVLTGATQTRALMLSQVLMPGEKLVADCVCVYQTKGIRAGQRVKTGGYSPVEVRSTVYRSHFPTMKRHPTRYSELDSLMGGGSLQSDVWNSVKNYSRGSSERISSAAHFMASASPGGADFGTIDPQTYSTPMDDLAGRMQEHGDKLKDILESVPKLDNQVGLVLLTLDGLESMESFNHPKSWDAIRKEILKSDSGKIADVSDQDSVFEYREEKAKSVIRALLTTKYDEKVAVEKERTSTILLDSKKLIGEVVVLNDMPIHCSFVKKAS